MQILPKACILLLSAALSISSAPVLAGAVQTTGTASLPVHTGAVKQQPQSMHFMARPQPEQFTVVSNKAGYLVSVPKAFGSDPLSGFKGIEGPMLLYTANSTTVMAVNLIDPMDFEHYDPIQALPSLDNKQLLAKWLQPSFLNWQCELSRINDYRGDIMLLEGQSPSSHGTYEILFAFPFQQYDSLLPQALYTMNSFRTI